MKNVLVDDGLLARNVLGRVVMNTERIDFISAYCDRWCERCLFTSRCSSYAVTVATEMCGDFEEGLELAVGRARPEPGEPDAHTPDWLADAANVVPTEEELREYAQQEAARKKRIEATRLSALAWTYTSQAHAWLKDRCEQLDVRADAVLAEALEIAAWDSALITVKVHRALHGRDEPLVDDEDHVQNDWNGSAKVALISMERSEAAWRTIAHATSDADAEALAALLHDLREETLTEFPDAFRFRRPGFDEPGR